MPTCAILLASTKVQAPRRRPWSPPVPAEPENETGGTAKAADSRPGLLQVLSHARCITPSPFQRPFHLAIQEALYRDELDAKLRPIQVEAIHEVLDWQGDLIIYGNRPRRARREAAFLPDRVADRRRAARGVARSTRGLPQGPDQ